MRNQINIYKNRYKIDSNFSVFSHVSVQKTWIDSSFHPGVSCVYVLYGMLSVVSGFSAHLSRTSKFLCSFFTKASPNGRMVWNSVPIKRPGKVWLYKGPSTNALLLELMLDVQVLQLVPVGWPDRSRHTRRIGSQTCPSIRPAAGVKYEKDPPMDQA